MTNLDPGQTEYEFPLSPPGPRQKKDLQESLLSYSEPADQRNNYLYVNIKDRSVSGFKKTKITIMNELSLQILKPRTSKQTGSVRRRSSRSAKRGLLRFQVEIRSSSSSSKNISFLFAYIYISKLIMTM